MVLGNLLFTNEEHFAGKIGKCTGSLMKTCTSTLGSQRHYHQTADPHQGAKTRSNTSCMLAVSGLRSKHSSLIASLLGYLPHFQDFLGSLKLTHLLGWDLSIHAAMHLPLQILAVSGAKI